MASRSKPKRVPSATDAGRQREPAISSELAVNPLAEPDMGKRLTLCFQAKGYTQKEFAKAIGCAPSTIFRWSNGGAPDKIEDFIRASKLLDYTIDELALGLDARIRSFGNEHPLTDQEINLALTQSGATPAQRRAFSEVEHERKPGGCLYRVLITTTFIQRFCDGYTKHRHIGHKRARQAALNQATDVLVVDNENDPNDNDPDVGDDTRSTSA